MGSDAFIVGLGETRHAPTRDDANTTELAYEAVSAALADAGVTLHDVTAVVSASLDFWEGRTISSMAVNEISGATFKSESKISADSAQALAYATARLKTDGEGLIVVVTHCKESQADPHVIDLAGFDPYYHRALDPDETVIAGFQAAQLGYSLDDRARVVAAGRKNSPWLAPLSAADVAASPETASPLHALERAPRMDGACAVILTDGATAKRLGRPAVRVAGSGTTTGSYWLDRDLTSANDFTVAFARALESAGWSDAPDHVELTTPYAHQALLFASALGTGGADAFENGTLSPAGGQFAGRPGVVAGLSGVISAVKQLQGTSNRAICHGATGLLAQSHHVICLEGA